ncbi:UNVERIFIED_CONTAM: hypothetical protein GTU68_041543 [Idotea baltica]|nr:hypothetical protein [Idotea baltica]
MGASGAGKTTLLNVLTSKSGNNLEIKGDLYVNGKRMSKKEFTKQSAYVQQDDLFIGTMTVKEQLMFQAKLRMDKHIPHEERIKRVEEVIQELGLMKCKDTLIGDPGRIKGISGGEMKRLAFACEVLTDPPLMFCDEPTSGLDSFMAQNIVTVMKSLGNRGKAIITTIHQPSSEVFALFDRVLLMAEGRLAYLGLTSDALKFFSGMGKTCPFNFNPADFFISTLAVRPGQEEECKVFVKEVCDTFRDSNDMKDITEAALANMELKVKRNEENGKVRETPYKATTLTQFLALNKRAFMEMAREPMLLRIKVIQTIVSCTKRVTGKIYFLISLKILENNIGIQAFYVNFNCYTIN